MTDSSPEATRSLEELERNIDEKFRDHYEESIFEKNPLEWLVYALAIVFFAYHLWYGSDFGIPRDQHGIIHLGLVLVLWGLVRMLAADRSTLRGKVETIAYGAYSVAALIPIYFLYTNYDEIVLTAGVYSDTGIMMGAMLIVLVLIALLAVSKLITVIAILGLVYSYYGEYMPGILEHRGLSLERVITMNTLEMEGLLGTLLQISATWVVIFLLLAGLMEKYGGMATFIKGMTRLAVRNRFVEIGQVAVAASMFMGSINGSTAANTATTGAFTIPLMNENGYKPKLSASIESVASCGGQILPPIMGAGAFIMAELIPLSYAEIIIGATAPALLFFLVVSVSITLNTQKNIAQHEITSTRDERTFGRRLYSIGRHYEYLGMFAVLIYYLVYVQADPMLAGYYSILTLLGLRLVRTVTSIVTGDAEAVPALRLYARQTLEGMRRGAEVTVSITILLASLGIVIRALIVTGFAQALSSYLIVLSGGEMLVMLALAAVASIAFGMGMSTTAAYLIVAILVAPALVEFGVEPFTAHLFVFYFAIVSNITPPIALSVIIAMGIAGSEFWETAVESLKIGYPMFLLPFAFYANEALLYPSSMTAVAFVIVLMGFIALSIGFTGQLREELSIPYRLAFVALGLGAIFANVLAIQLALTLAVFATVVYLIGPQRFPMTGTVGR
ncbi:TRAP transporter permease [Natrialbaceae archaeon A-gly3]